MIAIAALVIGEPVKLKITTHQLEGYNEQYCMYGGFAIQSRSLLKNVKNKYPVQVKRTDFGTWLPTKDEVKHFTQHNTTLPLICTQESMARLVGPFGEITLSYGQHDVIVYGFMGYVRINISIQVLPSECVGDLIGCAICAGASESVEHIVVYPTYVVQCTPIMSGDSNPVYWLYLPLGACLVLQVITYGHFICFIQGAKYDEEISNVKV